MLRLGAEMDGDEITAGDEAAEVMWADTEARSFGVVVDGLTKLVSVGVPLSPLLSLLPGVSQQQIVAMKQQIQAGEVSNLVSQLRQSAAAAAQTPAVADLSARTTPATKQPPQAPGNAVA